MSETPGTRGPWCDVFGGEPGQIGNGGKGLRVAVIDYGNAQWQENAKLICAAPDLYEALESLPLDAFDKDMDAIDAAEFVDYAGEFYEAMVAARAALREARGESA